MKRIILALTLIFFTTFAYASYQDGLAAEKRGDFKAALAAYLPLAKAGDLNSQLNLGYLYSANFQNYAQSFYWYNQAAKQNSPKAFESLGLLYLNGWGVERDSQKALEYFRKGAEAGDAYAMENLGVTLLTQASENPQSVQEGLSWMHRAAKAGDRVAQYNMGLFYTQGQFVEKDVARGIKYYKESAAQNEVEAMINLGNLYESGDKDQLKSDYAEAYRWYSLAGQFGDTSARDSLEVLKKKMDPTELTQGEWLLQQNIQELSSASF